MCIIIEIAIAVINQVSQFFLTSFIKLIHVANRCEQVYNKSSIFFYQVEVYCF